MKLTRAYDVKNKLTEKLLHSTGDVRKSFSIMEEFSYSKFIGDPVSSINGIGLGYNNNREYFIKVYTQYKVNLNSRYLSELFSINAHDLFVSNVGTIKSQALTTSRIRPAHPGISVAHYNVPAGTFGCVVQDDYGGFYILSNNHVLANCNNCLIGDQIIQPGSLDGGMINRDIIANLSDFVPLNVNGINTIDAAIAEPTDLNNIQAELPVIGRITGINNPRIGMRVAKFGRTTGYTTGVITARGVDIKVNFGALTLDFEDQFEIMGNNGKPFSSAGDSGSVIINIETKEAVGLLFAGVGVLSFANPITTVLNHFDLQIV